MSVRAQNVLPILTMSLGLLFWEWPWGHSLCLVQVTYCWMVLFKGTRSL